MYNALRINNINKYLEFWIVLQFLSIAFLVEIFPESISTLIKYKKLLAHVVHYTIFYSTIYLNLVLKAFRFIYVQVCNVHIYDMIKTKF